MAAAFIQHQRKRVLSLLGFALLADEDKEVMPNKRKRQQYMREWIARREEKGVYYQLIRESEVEDNTPYREFFRVSREQFLVSNLEVLDREDGQGNILPGHWRNDEASWQEFRPSVVTTTQMKHGLLERSTCNILIMKVQSNGNGDNVV
ncbi:Hypothetical predicted protein [Paramuricea clavata]|uniref:Uncharacterized protein n=1 Tax=Paramuricea clavata TaxID=317549 RepID=A0A7D9E8C0_PARCT|nr:Hypothetical predicted protein [Paramuricea clavata]